VANKSGGVPFNADDADADADDVVAVVSLTVANAGGVAGADVVQLYVAFPASANTAPRQLKAFQRTDVLNAGGKQTVQLSLSARDLSVFDETTSQFVRVKGKFTLFVAASSRDLRHAVELIIE
jgi:beta-glucosidase